MNALDLYFVLEQLQHLCSLVCPVHVLSYENLTLRLISK